MQMLLNYIELVKPRLSMTVLFSSVAGYLLATTSIEFNLLIKLVFGGMSLVGASNVLNQIYEVDLDVLMERTKNRPLPTKRVSINSALIFSFILALIGVLFLATINLRCAFFGALSCIIYVLGYTPLKTSTPISGLIGAFPGAIPFMLGWVAVTNKFSLETGILFAIQFLWQFPHFWSIAWVRYEDYKKAGIKLLPSGAKDHKTTFQIVFYTFWLIPMSISPLLLQYLAIKINLQLSIVGAVIIFFLGAIFLYQAFCLLNTQKVSEARRLMICSLVYLPLLQIIYIIDKYI